MYLPPLFLPPLLSIPPSSLEDASVALSSLELNCEHPTTHLAGSLGFHLGLAPMLSSHCRSTIDILNALYLSTLVVISALLLYLHHSPHYAHLHIRWHCGVGRCWWRAVCVTIAVLIVKALERWGGAWQRASMMVGVGLVVAGLEVGETMVKWRGTRMERIEMQRIGGKDIEAYPMCAAGLERIGVLRKGLAKDGRLQFI